MATLMSGASVAITQQALPDPCDGRGVGHFLRGPAGSGAIWVGPAAGGLGVHDERGGWLSVWGLWCLIYR